MPGTDDNWEEKISVHPCFSVLSYLSHTEQYLWQPELQVSQADSGTILQQIQYRSNTKPEQLTHRLLVHEHDLVARLTLLDHPGHIILDDLHKTHPDTL